MMKQCLSCPCACPFADMLNRQASMTKSCSCCCPWHTRTLHASLIITRLVPDTHFTNFHNNLGLEIQIKDFHCEYQNGIGRDATTAPPTSIAPLRLDGDFGLLASGHFSNRLVPALDHPPNPNRKSDGAGIKLFPILQRTNILHFHIFALEGPLRTIPRAQDFHLDVLVEIRVFGDKFPTSPKEPPERSKLQGGKGHSRPCGRSLLQWHGALRNEG
mmetsp:Transcript_137731/g.239490  ORF Transcript_137731/g.239490 Transcript_137731/m.239490 type:complete len:216 (-) Transcript_137731:212-859(-)